MCQNSSKRRVTVFDFDGTLTADDTFLSFARHCLGISTLIGGILSALPAIIGWKLRLIDNYAAKQRLYCALYKGKKRANVMTIAENWQPELRPETKRILDECKKRGDTIYIVSASLDLWLEEVASSLGVKLCCTATETDASGRLTGRFLSPNCHGKEKSRRLLEEEPDRDNYYLTVYGDSTGDRALFALADKPMLLRRGRFIRVGG